MDRKIKPIHPGEILDEEFLQPMGITAAQLAKDTGLRQRRVLAILRGQNPITADTALRLGRFFGTSERFWLNLQNFYDVAVEKHRLGKRLDREVKSLPKRTVQ